MSEEIEERHVSLEERHVGLEQCVVMHGRAPTRLAAACVVQAKGDSLCIFGGPSHTPLPSPLALSELTRRSVVGSHGGLQLEMSVAVLCHARTTSVMLVVVVVLYHARTAIVVVAMLYHGDSNNDLVALL